MLFSGKKAAKEYDREHLVPVLRCSICTAETSAGFRDVRTGKLKEVMLIRSPQDLERFKKEYGIEKIEKIY